MEKEPSRETMLARMQASDKASDGQFLSGLVTAGVYCLPSCNRRKPSPQSIHFFPTPESAETAGLTPCKRCRPDHFYRDREPNRQLVEALVGKLRKEPQNFSTVTSLASHAGINNSKLEELLRLHFHTTASELLARCRIDQVRHEFLRSDQSIAALASAAGFESLPSFEDQFRRHCFMGSEDYRRTLQTGGGHLHLPRWFNRERVLAYLGRDPESAHEQVTSQGFRCAAQLKQIVAIEVEVQEQSARFTVQASSLEASDVAEVHHRLLRLLGLIIDPSPFEHRASQDSLIHRLVGQRNGLTIPQTATFFDGIVWVIAGQQVSLPVAFALRRRLGKHCGPSLGDGLFAPPTAPQVAQLSPAELGRLGFSRRKSEYLLDLAGAVADGSFNLAGLAQGSAVELNRQLLARRGLGPWSVQYLMMRTFGFSDCVPLGDAALNRNLEKFFDLKGRPDRAATLRLMAPFAPHRSLATFHLWALDKTAQ